MSYRDRKDDRKREGGPDPGYSSSRRGLGSGRERERQSDYSSGRHARRSSRSVSPRRRADDRERRDDRPRDGRRSRSRSPRDHQKSRENEHDSRRKDDRRSDRKSDDKRERRHDSRERGSKRGEVVPMKEEQPEGSIALNAKGPIAAEDVTEEDMMKMMGFAGFGTTKGQAVEGNQEGGVKINEQRTWRQYMNRKGGFNRPLEKVK